MLGLVLGRNVDNHVCNFPHNFINEGNQVSIIAGPPPGRCGLARFPLPVYRYRLSYPCLCTYAAPLYQQ